MNSTYAVYLGVHLLSVLINLGLAVWVYRGDYGRSGRYFLGALSVALVYGGVAGVLIASPTVAMGRLLFPVIGFMAWLTTVAWLAFALQYAGYGHLLTRRTLGAMGLLVVVGGGLTLTDPVHGLVYGGYETIGTPYDHVEPLQGPLWLPLTVAGFGVGATTVGVLSVTALRARNLSRRQGALFAAAFVVSMVVSAALRADVRAIPPSIGGVVFNGTLAYMLSREQMLTVEPMTRTQVMDAVSDGVVAVTGEGRIVDYNHAAAALFPDLERGVGEPLRDVAPALAGAFERERDRTATDGGTATESGSAGTDPALAGGPATDLPSAGLPPTVGETPDRGGNVSVTVDGQRRRLAVRVDDVTRVGTRGHVIVLRDVTELEAYADSLERQTEQLDRFASVVSHDLRNPLSVAQLYLDEADDDSEEVAAAREAVERMDGLIDGALDLARQGRVVEDPDHVDLADAATEAWRFVDTDGDLELFVGGATVEADDERLRTLFENLFRNSAEHAAEDGSPRVSVGTVEDGFYVEDDGPGIPEDRESEVFREGYTTGEDGTGLGLAVVKSVARAHGWDVRVEDGADGGARFVFEGVRRVEAETAPAASN